MQLANHKDKERKRGWRRGRKEMRSCSAAPVRLMGEVGGQEEGKHADNKCEQGSNFRS